MSVRSTTEQYIFKAKLAHGDRYDYSKLSYINTKVKVEVVCRMHGSFWQWPADHRRGFGCPSCSNKKSHTTETYLEKAKAIHGERYDYSEIGFTTIDHKIIIICRLHGKFTTLGRTHIHGARSGCPMCCLSKGEIAIIDTLNELNVEYTTQKTFKGIMARFDFYLPKYNMCIEFDGAQHFNIKHIRRHFTQEQAIIQFQHIQRRDSNKNIFCSKNSIILLRISYLQLNDIKQILYEIFYNTSSSKPNLKSFRNEQLFLSSSAIYQRS